MDVTDTNSEDSNEEFEAEEIVSQDDEPSTSKKSKRKPNYTNAFQVIIFFSLKVCPCVNEQTTHKQLTHE